MVDSQVEAIVDVSSGSSVYSLVTDSGIHCVSDHPRQIVGLSIQDKFIAKKPESESDEGLDGNI